MRCLVVADLHYSLPQFDWLLGGGARIRSRHLCRRCTRHRLDGRFSRPDPGGQEVPDAAAGHTRVILCSGNHDLDERNAEGEKISRWVGKSANSASPATATASRSATPCSRCARGGTGRWSRAPRGPARDAAAYARSSWIWVHHAPPANSPTSWGGKRFFGDVELVQWIKQYEPSMVISGHVHQSPFIKDGSWFDRLGESWVFNTGLQSGRPPTYIVLDLDETRRSGLRPAKRKGSTSARHWAARRGSRCAAGLAYILGPDCRSEPGETSTGGRLIMLWSTSPTIDRCLP